jgi:hypothetical protein
VDIGSCNLADTYPNKLKWILISQTSGRCKCRVPVANPLLILGSAEMAYKQPGGLRYNPKIEIDK